MYPLTAPIKINMVDVTCTESLQDINSTYAFYFPLNAVQQAVKEVILQTESCYGKGILEKYKYEGILTQVNI